MKHTFIWEPGEVYLRCTIKPKVRIPAYDWGGVTKLIWLDAVGYIKLRADQYEAHIYGTVSPVAPKRFDNVNDAKTFVEEQSLIGLAVKRLGV